MSSHHTTAPAHLPSAPSTRVVVGKVLTVLASVVGPPAAILAAFAGSITYRGCFIDCNEATDHPDHLTGALLLALAALLVVAGPLLAATLVRRVGWVAGALAVPVVEWVLLFGGLSH